MKYKSKDLKEMANAVRAWALYAVRCAASGHVGIVLGAADVVTAVFANFLRRGRDRFVLSAGHGSALLYSVLKLAGYNVGDLDGFRKIAGLPGHPEYGIDGVDATTGPLGQGVANAVGMAMAEAYLAAIGLSDAEILQLKINLGYEVSPDTGDNGVALYVGLAVMAALGTAVVVGKKKEIF